MLFCLCLDTFAKISEGAEGKGQVRRFGARTPGPVHTRLLLSEYWEWPRLEEFCPEAVEFLSLTCLGGEVLRQLPGKCGPLVPPLSSRLSGGALGRLRGLGTPQGIEEAARAERPGCLHSYRCPRKPPGCDGVPKGGRGSDL